MYDYSLTTTSNGTTNIGEVSVKRRALVVVPENEQFVCATILEDGQMRVRLVSSWETELAVEEKEPGFRVLVPPVGYQPEEPKGYFVWSPHWTPFDQNYWLSYFQKVVKGGVKLPDLLLKDLDFVVRHLKSKNSSGWAGAPIQDNPKFARLYAILLGFKALSELRRNKLSGLQSVGIVEREGSPGNPYPGRPLAVPA